MNPFNLLNYCVEKSKKFLDTPRNNDLPIVIEGADVFDVLCPVSKKTGHRENPLTLLTKVLPPDKERLASMILQQIPSIHQENPNISDSDAIDLCLERLSTGSLYEDNQVRSALLSVADVLFPEQVASEVKPSVEAEASEADVVDNV